MPKAGKAKFYAVAVGKQGPKIYTTWDECKLNTSRYPGAQHKSFQTHREALEWLNSHSTVTSKKVIFTTLPNGSDSDIEVISGPSTVPSHPPPVRLPPPLSYQEDSDIEILDHPSLNTDRKVSADDIILSSEQRKVLQRVKSGKNVFFTGSAGTGKSVLLREIINYFGGTGSPKLAITASTGIAAVNIGGTTLHSWAGIGLGEETAEKFAAKFRYQKKFDNVLQRWRQVRTLIIDEISMLDGALFDMLEHIARETRGISAPFGGMQLILSGDFCQLPPVPNTKDGKKMEATFAFEAQTWSCMGSPIMLKKVFRQKDQAFVNMLNEMRFGQTSEATATIFKGLSRTVQYNDSIEPTQLFPYRAQVDSANSSRLSRLPGDSNTYVSLDIPGVDSKGQRVSERDMDRLLERLVVPKSVTLKVGAQVMLVKNLQQGHLVNGSVGTIISFSKVADAVKHNVSIGRIESGGQAPPVERDPMIQRLPLNRIWPVVRFLNGKELLCIPLEFTVNNSLGEMEARRDQVPLILAWALSIHKSQGQTLERVKVDLGRVFEKGQAYVALSRATNLEHLQVLNFDASKVTAHPKVLAWFKKDAPPPADIENPYDDPYYDDEMDNEEAIAAYHTFR